MHWIKRNLFFFVFGLMTAIFLVGSSIYLYSRVQQNSQVTKDLEQQQAMLDRLLKLPRYPSQANIDVARKGERDLQALTTEARKHFAAIPVEKVTGLDFKKLLDTTIFELRNKANQNSVELPSKDYAFSFSAQKDKARYAPGSFPVLPEQLAETKLLCNYLFDARINHLVNLKRSRVTADDPGQSVDYHSFNRIVRADLGLVFSRYEVTFHSFSSELASALENLYRSPYGFIVKAIALEPAGARAGAPAASDARGAAAPPRGQTPRGQPNRRPPTTFSQRPPTPTGRTGARRPVPTRPRGAAPAAANSIETVLNEQLLRIVLSIEVIKPGK